MVDSSVPLVVLVSDNVWERRKDALLETAPHITPIVYKGNEMLPADVLDSITVAFFSGDIWPERTRGFMLSALKSPNLSWLHTFSAGIDNAVFTTFRERGIRLSTSSGAAASPIAQTVIMYMLALSRNLPLYMQHQRNHQWSPHSFHELDGATVAVIGLGPIGREVVRLSQALQMNVVACRRSPSGDDPCPTYPLTQLREVVSGADWVVIALPLTEDTRNIIDASVISSIKPGAGFVNIGRGELVDEPALIEALRSGQLASAGLDVVAQEPLPEESPLWDMPNVIITPHASGQTHGSYLRAEELFVENLGKYVQGQTLTNEVL
jgi:phosphoglycerate dehydrogenase-like enzyme